MFYKRSDGKLMIAHGIKRIVKIKETLAERHKRLEEEF